MAFNVYKEYLGDLGCIMKEYALAAKEQQRAAKGTCDEDFRTGYLHGFHRIISLMQQQAEGFEIPLSELKLDDIDADRDLT